MGHENQTTDPSLEPIPEATAASRPSLLLVDDVYENLVALRAILEDFDLELVSCQSGRDALRQVLKRDFALILLDVNMPDMDGFEVASMLRKRQKSAGIPIIFMTASTASELQMFQGYALGAVDYLWKPIVPGMLRSKVMVFVELYQRRAELERQSARLLELERMAHAQALQDERDRHQADLGRILDAAGEGIFGVDADGSIGFINPAGAQLLGAGSQDLLGREAHRLLHPLCPGPGCELAEAIGGGVVRHSQAESFWRAGKPFPAEYVSRPIEGGGTVLTFQDISERRSLEAQLLQSQKMEAIGRLAGGVAHDFNNILTLIQGYGDLLMSQIKDQSEAAELLQVMLDAGDRAANLTRQLLLFSRKQLVRPQPVEINARLSQLEQLLRRLIGEDIQLQTQLEADLPPIQIDPGHFDQVVMNLAVNARDAMPQGGVLSLRTTLVVLDAGYLSWHPDLDPGSYVLLTVGDSGSGMDAETLAHLFEPFYTTKGEGQGTGLGLATVYSILRQNGGQVLVYSEPGEGTVFKLYFPLGEAGVSPDPVRTTPLQSLSGHERILVVEDDPAVRRLICGLLSERGYEVQAASQGREALSLSDSFEQPPDLLLTDVIMPEMSGAELGQTLGQRYPGLRVLYMSGYTDDLLSRQGLREAGASLLEKPFTPGALLSRVREALNEPVQQGKSASQA